MENKIYHIGRDSSKNQIYINDASVSSIHCQLVFFASKWALIDLGSSNGTFINNEKILSKKEIDNNHVIKFGEFISTKKEILNAVRKYEFEKKKNISCSVPLGGGRHVVIDPSESTSFKAPLGSGSSNKKITLTSVLYALLILASTSLIIGGTVFFSKQYYMSNNDYYNLEEDNVDESSNSKSKKKTRTQNSKIKKQKKINYNKYDMSCYGLVDPIINLGETAENILLSGISVSLSDEVNYGKDILAEYKKRESIVSYGPEVEKLQKIVKKLVERLAKPRGFKYKVYFVKNNIVNAYTAGGLIFFYKGMYDFCDNDSELAAILSHEIAHNELRHITKMVKKKKAGLQEIDIIFKNTIGGAFSQHDEAQCDLFGMDLVFPTNYKNCAAIDLWKKMDKKSKSDLFRDFFGTHPSDKKRAICIEKHLKKHYKMSCE